jgi:small subunit ribosomal protein S3
MGQKIHPTGFRLSVQKNWSSKWYANKANFPIMLQEDIKVREYLKKKLSHASVSRITIERPSKNARFTIYTSRPGIVIGKKGEDIEFLRGELQKRMGVPVHVNIEEIRKPEIDAQLISDNIAQQLEKRIMFRRAMKRSIQNAMRLGAQGIKIQSAGRLNGIEIARCEWYREGRVPLHTLRADIDYGTSTAQTTYGAIGIKVWVFKGEIIGRSSDQSLSSASPSDKTPGLDQEKKKKRLVAKPTAKKTKPTTDKKPVKAVSKSTATKAKIEVTDKLDTDKKIIAKKVTKSPAKVAKVAKVAKEVKEVKKGPATKKTKSTAEKDDKSTSIKKSKIKDTVKTPGAKDATTS